MEKDEVSTQEFLEFIAESMPGNFYWKDGQGNYLGCNHKIIEVLGFNKKSELVGKNDKELWPEQAEYLKEHDQKVMRLGIPQFLEETITVNNELKYFTVIKTPLKNNNDSKIIGIIGNSINITKQKHLELALKEQVKETEKAYRSRTEFLSMASHEIRGPVGNVLSSLDTLAIEIEQLRDQLSQGKVIAVEEIQRFLDSQNNRILNGKSEANRALNALKLLGNLYKFKSQGISTEFVESSLHELLQDAITATKPINKYQIPITLSINSTVPSFISFDRLNLEEVLITVIINAIRFNHEKGKVTIHVNTINKGDQKILSLAIQDTGKGMPSEQLTNLLKTFLNDEEYNEKTRYLKPSIQLSIADMKMKAMGGYLQIASIADQGTTVTLYVPYQAHNEIKSLEEQAVDVTDRGSLAICSAIKPLYILLVEDDPVTLKETQQHLIKLGHQVDVASTGLMAVALGIENFYDIVMIDISLPDINGVEVMQRIQASNSNNNTFVAVTSHTSDEDKDYFAEQGIMAILIKPVSREIFKSCIEDVIAAKAALFEDD